MHEHNRVETAGFIIANGAQLCARCVYVLVVNTNFLVCAGV